MPDSLIKLHLHLRSSHSMAKDNVVTATVHTGQRLRTATVKAAAHQTHVDRPCPHL